MERKTEDDRERRRKKEIGTKSEGKERDRKEERKEAEMILYRRRQSDTYALEMVGKEWLYLVLK